jgi:hypothetical protein
MKRRMIPVRENGRLVWRVTEGGAAAERRVEAPCDALRRAKELALRAVRELEAEKNAAENREKKDGGAGRRGEKKHETGGIESDDTV